MSTPDIRHDDPTGENTARGMQMLVFYAAVALIMVGGITAGVWAFHD